MRRKEMNNMYDNLLIQRSYWSGEEWEKISRHVAYYNGDYDETEDEDLIVHCHSESEYWELYDFLHKLGN